MKASDDFFEYPGTICEWPDEGPGSGKGPYGFACKHCGRGHTEHGLGDAYADIVARLGVAPKDQHRICKIPKRREPLPKRREPHTPPAKIESDGSLSMREWSTLTNLVSKQIALMEGAAYGAAYFASDLPFFVALHAKCHARMFEASHGEACEPRYTIVVPFVPREHATRWHPTEATGPFATLVRGEFKTFELALAWAREHLNGTPYTIKLVTE